MSRPFHRSLFSLSAVAPLFVACGSEAPGTVRVTAYGESFVEEGIPAADLVDGYAIAFTRFAVRIEDFRLGDELLEGPYEVNLTPESDGKGHDLDELSLPSGTYDGAGFSLSRVEVAGTAAKDGRTYSFEWSFPGRVDYTDCAAEIVVDADGDASFEITVHADHLFYDSLATVEPNLSFQPYADADLDEDGQITEEELREADLGPFDPGSEDGIDDLWTYLARQVGNLGHANGEAHCDARLR